MSGARIARLGEAEWRVFAALRMRTLTDVLGATDARCRQEQALTAAQWRRRSRTHVQFGAFAGERPVGLICVARDTSTSAYLFSLWLEPAARGRGSGRALVRAAVDWARAEGLALVTLRVEETNAAARRVYESLGFGVTTSAAAGSAVAARAARAGEVTMALSVR